MRRGRSRISTSELVGGRHVVTLLTGDRYGPKITLKVKVGDEVKEEEGILFSEATFITEV